MSAVDIARIIAASDLAFSEGMERFLLEDIQHGLKMRLFKAARTGWEDSTLQGALKALGSGAEGLKAFEQAVGRFDSIYFTIMEAEKLSPRGVERLRVAFAKFRQTRADLLHSKNEDVLDLISWTDRDFAERMRCVDVRLGKRGPAGSTSANRTAPNRRTGKAKSPKQISAKLRMGRAGLLYRGFVDSLSAASTAERNSLWRFNDYLSRDDPVWGRLVDLMGTSARLPAKRNAVGASLADAVQGIVGEALALRHRAVTDIMHAQFKRAQRLAAQLGTGWDVKVIDSAVWGDAKQLYDGAVMVVNAQELITAPVFVLSVKSGMSIKAAIQSTSETLREFGQRLTFAAPGPGQGATFELNNLESLLAERGVNKATGAAEELSTYRLLVAPRPPSERRTAEDLGADIGLWFMPAILSKKEMNDGAGALTRGLKRALAAAKKAKKGESWDDPPDL